MPVDAYPNCWPWREGHVKPPAPDALLRALLEQHRGSGLPLTIRLPLSYISVRPSVPAPLDDDNGYWAD